MTYSCEITTFLSYSAVGFSYSKKLITFYAIHFTLTPLPFSCSRVPLTASKILRLEYLEFHNSISAISFILNTNQASSMVRWDDLMSKVIIIQSYNCKHEAFVMALLFSQACRFKWIFEQNHCQSFNFKRKCRIGLLSYVFVQIKNPIQR